MLKQTRACHLRAVLIRVSASAALQALCAEHKLKTTRAQDFPVHQGIVWHQWRSHKMDEDACCRDLVRCRDPRAPMALQAFEYLRKKETMLNLQDEIERVQEMLRKLQLPFKAHPQLSTWQLQFLPVNYGKIPRITTLALVGGTKEGKTTRGIAIFGVTKTLKVSCQGCPKGVLPGLNAFTRGRHVAILFDECRVDQILENREFFQSSVFSQQLSQSACNQYSYQLWVYQIAMIVCTNSLPMTVAEGLSASDADWLAANVVKVTLEPGQTWYVQS